jgi:glycosyltransferase involved in cell wall biosynthesis
LGIFGYGVKMLVSVIPCYNNGGSIGALVREMDAYVDGVVVVDDGSADNTQEEAKAAGARVIRLERNKGKAEAVRTGLRCALYELNADEILTHLDGDGEHRPSDIPALKSEYGGKTLVIGRRRTGPATMRNALYFMMTDLLDEKLGLRVTDPLCGFRLFSREFGELVLEKSKAENFGLELEELFLACQNGYVVKQVPISSSFKRKAMDANMAKPKREIEDNVNTILKYADFLGLSKRETDDINYAFFGNLPETARLNIVNGKLDI